MSLQIGERLGSYEITALLGKGGMGEVWRASDTKLKRDVAIKILPEEFSQDHDRLVRFQREAELLASLNHTNIAAIHDLQEANGSRFLIMELVEGETLADRIARGAVPLDEALNIARQICEALEAAHERGIVHRDLKPANVKILPNGKVKVLDFGLAKAMKNSAVNRGVSNSPTLSMAATNAGLILGTPPYMSPEQAKGRPVDQRTDIFAFGCVLYEMLTGRQVFSGESTTDILGAILHKEPDFRLLPEGTPHGIRVVLRRCLEKDAGRRFHAAADVVIQIEETLSMPSTALAAGVAERPPGRSRRTMLIAGCAYLAAAAIGGIAVWHLRPLPTPPSEQVSRTIIALPTNSQLVVSNNESLAISPDGANLAYLASDAASQGRQVFVRPLDAIEARPIGGTGGASSVFFSPDGQWIGFSVLGALKKVHIGGGAALTVAPVPIAFRGATWGSNDTIVFAESERGALYQVPAAGGEPQRLTTLKQGEGGHRWPQVLSDGRTILFTITGALSQTNSGESQIAVQRLGTAEHQVLIRGGTYGRYVPTGHIVYYRAGAIMAVPFDPVRLELKGTPVPILEGIMGAAGGGAAPAGQFSFSERGSLVYIQGNGASTDLTLVWVDRNGVAKALPAPPAAYDSPRLSPDGQKVALDIGPDVWIYDIPRDTLSRLTFEGNNTVNSTIWSPDGKRVVYPSDKAGPINLFWKPADGSGTEERLTIGQYRHFLGSFTPDGRTLVYHEVNPKTSADIWLLSLDGDRKPRIFLQTAFNDSASKLSPDGHWLAYLSDESGRFEVYVRPFPGPGGKWQISTEGGTELMWSPKGNELFYRTGGQKEKMMAVDIQTQPTFSPGKPRLLFQGPYASGAQGAWYSVAPDGQHFLMLKAKEQQQTALTQIHLVVNWFEELKRRVPH